MLNGSRTASKAERARSPVFFIPTYTTSFHSLTEKRKGTKKPPIRVITNVKETRNFLLFILLPSSLNRNPSMLQRLTAEEIPRLDFSTIQFCALSHNHFNQDEFPVRKLQLNCRLIFRVNMIRKAPLAQRIFRTTPRLYLTLRLVSGNISKSFARGIRWKT